MRKLLLFALLSSQCWGAVAIVNSASFTKVASFTSTIAVTISLTSGNQVACYISQASGASLTISIASTNIPSGWTQVGTTLNNPDRNINSAWFYATVASTASDTVTGTFNGTPTSFEGNTCYQISGGVFDSSCTGHSSGSSGTTATCGTITLAGTDVVMVGMSTSNTGQTYTAGSGFTIDHAFNAGDSNLSNSGGVTESESGVVTSSTPTVASSAPMFWNILGVAFKPSGGGAVATPGHAVIF